MNIDQAFAAALAQQQAGRLEEAGLGYREILATHPDQPEVHYNLGIVLRTQGKLREAVSAYERALELRPHFPEAVNNLAATFESLGALDEAEDLYRHGLLLDPHSTSGWSNLGGVLKDLGRLDEAIECFDRALEFEPNDARIRSNRLFTLHYSPKYDAAALGEAAAEWGRLHAPDTHSSASSSGNANSPVPGRRLRIGYVSGYFREHCQAFFILPLFSHHDHQTFEIFAYHDSPVTDAITDRLKSHATEWRLIHGQSDQAVVELIRRDQIDILVDLTLHMDGHRLGVFALKPAPVQITWLGYPGTTGVSAIDYRITDSLLDPPGRESFYTEKSQRLPDSFWCYDPLTFETTVSPLPATSTGKITFGCLNNFCKVTDETLTLWAQVLRSIPESRLLLLAPEGATRARVKNKLGVMSDRIEFVAYQPRSEYLKLYHRIDLGLDTFPYNGHTTTLDALWMGVPVISLQGSTAVSRAGLSLMTNLGLPEFVTANASDYIQRAKQFAGNPGLLAELRTSLRGRMEQSPLMDAAHFAHGLENAYREVWQKWCNRQLPA